MDKKYGLVVEGGAMRSIYSIGVLDALIENNYYNFDICIGVSAGSTALASYLAGMHKRNYRVTTDYSTRKDFISKRKLLKGGHYMDLDWIWDYCEKYDPLDVEAIVNRKIRFLVGVTSVETGQIEYIDFDKENSIDLLKASCALPIAYKRPVKVEGRKYFDGGIADPIPVEEAVKRGANQLLVIRSRKEDFRMKDKSNKLQSFILHKYKNINKSISKRSKRYNSSIEFMRKEHDGINIIEINPPSDFQTSRFTKDKKILNDDYKLGLESGYKLVDFLRGENL